MSDGVLSVELLRTRWAGRPALVPKPATPARFKSFLDRMATALREPELVAEAWPRLVQGIGDLRAGLVDPIWRGRLREHPIQALLQEEPATAWSISKPRGHAGDARLMDFLYDHPAIRADLDRATARGRAMHAALISGPTAVAAQESRRVLAQLLDTTVERVKDAQVLVLGAGHMREAEQARALSNLGRLVVLDQDEEATAEACRALEGRAPVTAVTASARRLAQRPDAYGAFDFIYAAGLFDYLDDETARNLLRALFPILRPGGRLLLTNFRPGTRDEAYLDAYMDWRMFRRDEAEIQGLLEGLPKAAVARSRVFPDGNGAMLYASLEARAR